MSNESSTSKKTQETPPEQIEKKPFSFGRFMLYIAVPPIIFIILLFLIGIALALFTDPSQTAPRIGMIRDVFIIILAFEFILVILALVALILQIAKLIATLDDEIKPILENTKETLETARQTAKFVGKNITAPILSISSFFAGLFAFLRDVGGIRRAVRKTKPKDEKNAQ